ncbi:hypothetical protein HBH98_048490 [Parastagonospora nodorum]|nr:hypothetical protein HBH98_048490 [Parastagonospora nodorum]KAH4380227.1 hypothetical protein HBH97_093370 [Parastagonospora nodorum]KAH4424978.1 hypothetical protein HBH99_036080 [Parastagonospora nodorum]KAH6496859.1 hypothetical protein HBI55_090890 [Parastagonospora nodorum]
MGRIKEPESPEITPRTHPASAAVPPLQFLHFWSTEFAAMVETVTWKAVATRQETPEDASRLLWNWDSRLKCHGGVSERSRVSPSNARRSGGKRMIHIEVNPSRMIFPPDLE